MLAVIMAGGVGERFWPSSRTTRPKQLLDLTDRGSMIRLTLERLEGLASPEETLVVTNAAQRRAILREVGGRVVDDLVIGEPEIRNTAPAIGLAAVLLAHRFGDRPVLVLPADHLIEPAERFRELVRAGERYVAAHDDLLTFGIRPTRAETGYGYIEAGEKVWGEGGVVVRRAAAFVEKPSMDRALSLVAGGRHRWNSGIFMWRTGTVLASIARHLPELHAVLRRIEAGIGTRPLDQVLNEEYPRSPSISIDHGVMEKAANVAVLEADFRWSDVGSWEFVREVHPPDERGNVAVGEHVLIDASDNTIVSRERLIGLIGVEGLAVVDSGDAVLVCRRDRVQDVRKIVAELKRRGRDDLV